MVGIASGSDNFGVATGEKDSGAMIEVPEGGTIADVVAFLVGPGSVVDGLCAFPPPGLVLTLSASPLLLPSLMLFP